MNRMTGFVKSGAVVTDTAQDTIMAQQLLQSFNVAYAVLKRDGKARRFKNLLCLFASGTGIVRIGMDENDIYGIQIRSV